VRPLNDDQLNSLLKQAKTNQPKPPSGFDARVMQMYDQRQSSYSPIWRCWVSGTIRVPAPIAVLASVVLILIGMVVGDTLRKTPNLQQRAVTKSAGQDPPVLNLDGLQPVAELRPRIVRKAHENTQQNR
jgi:hypothetical protein